MKKILLWLASASILLIVVCIGIPLGLIINKVINVEEDCFGNRYGLMDIYIQEEEFHLVFGDDTGFSFEMISQIIMLGELGMHQTIDSTYIAAVVNDKQDELEELNNRYSGFIIMEYQEENVTYRLAKPENIGLEEWIGYVAEYIYEKDMILSLDIEWNGLLSLTDRRNRWDYCTPIEGYGDWVHSYSDNDRFSQQEVYDILYYSITEEAKY